MLYYTILVGNLFKKISIRLKIPLIPYFEQLLCKRHVIF